MTAAASLAEVCSLQIEALFASDLQPSDEPGSRLIQETVTAQVFYRGQDAIAALVAQEFGEHPEQAVQRMRWCRSAVEAAYAVLPV